MAAQPLPMGHPPRLNMQPFVVHPQWPNALQTPMQPFFPPQPPNAPGRPTYQHHKTHSSMAHYPTFQPPPAIPMTPLGQPFPIVAPPFGQPFMPRNRRAPSISIGGPPKAPLGGPGRKHSPLPPVPPAPAQKGKKIIINLPVETIPATENEPLTRPPWARMPMPTTSHEEPVLIFPEIASAEPYPPDNWRRHIPDTVDVFLPGKVRITRVSLCVFRLAAVSGRLGRHQEAGHRGKVRETGGRKRNRWFRLCPCPTCPCLFGQLPR